MAILTEDEEIINRGKQISQGKNPGRYNSVPMKTGSIYEVFVQPVLPVLIKIVTKIRTAF